MKRKYLTILVLFILLIVVFFSLKLGWVSLFVSGRQTMVPASVHKCYCGYDPHLLEFWASRSKPQEGLWGFAIESLSYGNPKTCPFNNSELTNAEIELINSLSPKIVTIHLDYEWLYRWDLETIRRINSTIEGIRSLGVAVGIVDIPDEFLRSAVRSSYGKKTFLEELTNALVRKVKNVVQNFKPDYYVVLNDPLLYTEKIGGFPKDINFWVSLTRVLAKEVKSIRPETKVGIGVRISADDSIRYLRSCLEIPEIDFIVVNLYSKNDVMNVSRVMREYMREFENRGKRLWIQIERTKVNEVICLGGVWICDTSAIFPEVWVKAMSGIAQGLGAETIQLTYTPVLNFYIPSSYLNCYSRVWRRVIDLYRESRTAYYRAINYINKGCECGG